MSWKEFFKLTRNKIIIAIITFIVISFIPIVPYYCVYLCEGCAGIEYRPMIAACEFILATYIVILIELILSYTISCLITFVYNKIKSKNKKR